MFWNSWEFTFIGGLSRLSGSTSYDLQTGWVLSYNRFINPVNSLGQKLLNGTNWTGMRGTGNFIANQPIKYIFGKNIPKQKRPLKLNPDYPENGDELFIEYWIEGIDWDPSDYIASVDMEVSLKNKPL